MVILAICFGPGNLRLEAAQAASQSEEYEEKQNMKMPQLNFADVFFAEASEASSACFLMTPWAGGDRALEGPCAAAFRSD